MAIAAGVSTAKGQTATGSSITTSGIATQASGSIFVVGLAFDSAVTFTSITDNKSNSPYVQLGAEQTYDAAKIRLYYFVNGAGGAGHTFTGTVSSTSRLTIVAQEITGAATSSPLDKNPGANEDLASPFTTLSTGTLSQATELVLAVFFGNSAANNAITESTGFTVNASAPDGTQFWTGAIATVVVASTAARQASFTDGGQSTDTALQIVSFIPPAAGGGVPYLPLLGAG